MPEPRKAQHICCCMRDLPISFLHAQRLVETAMLAAVGGVAYTLAVVLKLQSYLGYLQPMPIIVAAMRWGPSAARKTMTATFFLLLGVLPLPAACIGDMFANCSIAHTAPC